MFLQFVTLHRFQLLFLGYQSLMVEENKTFHVWLNICCENMREFVVYSDEKSDPGRNKYVSVELTSLQAATPYIFYISSSNDYGSSKSTNVFCNTTAGTYL
jgi:hypothetical protein